MAFFASCIVSGTITFIYDIDEFYSHSGSIQTIEVNLADNSDYNDNKDKIKSINHVAVVGTIENLMGVSNSAEVYISDIGTYTNPDTIRLYGKKIFTSPSVPGNDSVFINWSDGLQYIENLPDLKAAVESGYFWIYSLAENPDFNMRFKISFAITMTVGA